MRFLTLEIEGIAQIKQTGSGSGVKASVRGLEPGTHTQKIARADLD